MPHSDLIQTTIDNILLRIRTLTQEAERLARDPRFSQFKQDQASLLRRQASLLEPQLEERQAALIIARQEDIQQQLIAPIQDIPIQDIPFQEQIMDIPIQDEIPSVTQQQDNTLRNVLLIGGAILLLA